jgi:hypothetical protein
LRIVNYTHRTGRFDQNFIGHDDEEDDVDLPSPMFKGFVDHAAVGWGHTAIITDGNLLMTGRPHDFTQLLRLRRFPQWFRDYAVHHTYETTHHALENNILHPTHFFGRVFNSIMERAYPEEEQYWEEAKNMSFMSTLTKVDMPDYDSYAEFVACSAGLSTVVSSQGILYTFGQNQYGQCGIGHDSIQVYTPTEVVGLNAERTFVGERKDMEQSYPIVSASLGLQHGIALNTNGEIFGFGKGTRGQLGHFPFLDEVHHAVPIDKAWIMNWQRGKHAYMQMPFVRQISTGMLHSAALTVDNQVFLWGKNILPQGYGFYGGKARRRAADDARVPVQLDGLPKHLEILKIACGSHHTAVLFEDGSVYAVGITTDTQKLIHHAVPLIPAGVIEMPVRQFDAHFDRTTVVGASGRQVLQVHLWEDQELQEYAPFTPAWIDRVFEEDYYTTIREVHRSWLHSIVVTD